MTFEEWVQATAKDAFLREDAAPSIHATAFDAFSGEAEEEEIQNPHAVANPDRGSISHPLSLLKKPLEQPCLRH